MYNCLECTYNTEKKYNLDRHIISKHKISNPNGVIPNPKGVIPNQCEKCQKVYSSKGNLNKHLLICKGPIIDVKICEYCKKTLASKRNKENHLTTCKEKALTVINNNSNNDRSKYTFLSFLKTRRCHCSLCNDLVSAPVKHLNKDHSGK